MRLTQKDSGWRKGRLPDDALQAFRNIIRALTSAPTMAHADPNRPFILSCVVMQQEVQTSPMSLQELVQYFPSLIQTVKEQLAIIQGN